MFFCFISLRVTAIIIFGIALLLLISSLGLSIRELVISTRALEIHLNDLENK